MTKKKKPKSDPSVRYDLTPKQKDEIMEEAASDFITDLDGGMDEKVLKRVKFFIYWFLGYPPLKAAEKADFTPQYGYRLIQMYRDNSKLRAQIDKIVNAMPDKYRGWSKLKLQEVAEIKEKGLEYLKDNPDQAVRHSRFLRGLEEVAGVLEPDTAPRTIINIASVERLQAIIGRDLDERLAIPEGEIVEEKLLPDGSKAN